LGCQKLSTMQALDIAIVLAIAAVSPVLVQSRAT
jgi:hypothetical protein